MFLLMISQMNLKKIVDLIVFYERFNYGIIQWGLENVMFIRIKKIDFKNRFLDYFKNDSFSL